MFAAAYRALELDWRYIRLPLAPDRFHEVAGGLSGSGYRGVNVTMPHKLAALELSDEATPAARAIGAANTLTFAEGRIEADNTDAGGFLDALEGPVAGRSALVLGAGGGARAVAWALREAGAQEVTLWNRTPGRAAALAQELGVRHLDHPEPADLVVNATPVGLDPPAREEEAVELLELDRVGAPEVVVDLVYGEEPTPVCAWAGRGGARVVDGVEVLVRQGARSFRRWTGMDPSVQHMRDGARRR